MFFMLKIARNNKAPPIGGALFYNSGHPLSDGVAPRE